MADFFDEARIGAIREEVACAVDAAAFGEGPWDEVPSALSRAFPGSFSGLWNLNNRGSLNFLSFANIDPAFEKTYGDHFAYINPWTSYWSAAPNGLVALSEDLLPARLFAKTEFYNDWLVPQKNAEAGAGLKLVGGEGELIQVVLHFPLSLSESYDRAAVEVLKGIRGNLNRSIGLARLLRTDQEKAAAASALVERSRCAAFVIDETRRIREANPSAVKLFSSTVLVNIRNDRCFLADRNADARFGMMLNNFTRGIHIDDARMSVRTPTGSWQIIVAPLPRASSSASAALLLPPRQLVLVLVTELNPAITELGNLSILKATFGLTASEIMFCQRLLLGESLADIAQQLSISIETVRSKLKSVFRKTGTSKQGQLLLLLSKL